jgi:hypothetical protein
VYKNLVPAVAHRVVDYVNPHPPVAEVFGKDTAPLCDETLASMIPNLTGIKLIGNLAMAEEGQLLRA